MRHEVDMSGTRTLIDLSPREATAAREIALRYGNRPDALRDILHDLQEELGFGPEAALPALAKSLNLSRRLVIRSNTVSRT
jgi:NADH:ubiquinone oxidoreductase subunit E